MAKNPKRHLQPPSILNGLPESYKCERCNRVGDKPHPCPLAEALGGETAASKHPCNCCAKCSFKCYMEV